MGIRIHSVIEKQGWPAIGFLGDHYSVGFGILSVCVPAGFLAACVAFAATGFVKLSITGGK